MEFDGLAGPLWIKRDDQDAPEFGGNKVRALEFLLGGLEPGQRVVTIGGDGSTHVLATAWHARRLGLIPRAVRWPHEMGPVGPLVAARAAALCERVDRAANTGTAFVRARASAWRHGDRWIPIGGSSPLGAIGHVNAGLELGEQVSAGLLPEPARVVVPLGSAGTSAGLALGLRLAGLRTIVVGVRVAPPVTARRAWVLRLARRTAKLLEQYGATGLPAVERRHVEVVHEMYGGAYGRPFPPAEEAARLLAASSSIRLDSTYSAKAFAAALALARRDPAPTLFWLTFDARWMQR